jgi:hypothetical protein
MSAISCAGTSCYFVWRLTGPKYLSSQSRGLRAGPAAGEGCDAAGQMIDFPRTKAERLATGDPRRSIEERYPDHEEYIKKVTKAAKKLHRKGFLLEEDVLRYIDAAGTSDIGK